MRSAKRIICYAINGGGMGHVTRLLGIAHWLRRYTAFVDHCPAEILFLTSSDASDLVAAANFAAFKLPSKTVVRSAGMDKLEYRRLAKQFVWHVLGTFHPDLLIVDTFPAGSFEELFQILDGPFKKAFVHRNVKASYANRPTFRSAMGMYDSIIVPHRPDKANGATTAAGVGYRFCGEVVQFEKDELPSRHEIRRELGVDSQQRLIYLSAGGGGDPAAPATLHLLINEVRQVDSDAVLLVGAGPLYRGPRQHGERLIWSEGSAVWRYFVGCDAAISAGGYNSFHELLYCGVPSLFYPQEKIADDQWARVQEAEQAGACLAVESFEDTFQLREKIRQLLNPQLANSLREQSSEYLPENGARRCALELLRPFYHEAQLAAAHDWMTPRLFGLLGRISAGSVESVSDWLAALFPQGRQLSFSRNLVIDSIIDQLSPAAASELRAVIDRSNDDSQRQEILVAIEGLADRIDLQGSTDEARLVAEEVLRTVQVCTKRYAYLIYREERCSGLELVSLLGGLADFLSNPLEKIEPIETIRLLRLFPRFEDVAHIGEVLELFRRYLQHRLAQSEPVHLIMQRLQLLKMSHSSVRKTMLDLPMESIS